MKKKQKARLMLLAAIVISFLITLTTIGEHRISPLGCWLCCMAAFFMGANTTEFLDDWEKAKEKKDKTS